MKNRTMFVLILTILLLSSCAPIVTNVYNSSGEQAYLIECGGAYLSWASCHKQAGEICGEKGYTYEQKEDSQTVNSTPAFRGYGANGVPIFGVNQVTQYNRSFVVTCKKDTETDK